VSELGERLFLDSGTLTPLLKRLEAAGCERQRDAGRAPRAHRLTPQGRALRERPKACPPACWGSQCRCPNCRR
jgi:DNA-binding MarR family transcriptional regulator